MLDLDDLCSPLGEHGTSHGHQDVRSHLEHPHVSERSVHYPSLDFPGRTLALQVNARLNYRPARSAAPVATTSHGVPAETRGDRPPAAPHGEPAGSREPAPAPARNPAPCFARGRPRRPAHP